MNTFVLFLTRRKRNNIIFMSLSTHTNNEYCRSFSFVYNDSHSNIAYSATGFAGAADAMWSIPVPCSQSTYITGPTLTSQVFIDALTASSHGNLPCLMAPDSSSEQLTTILNHKQHIQIHLQNITLH